MAARSCVSASDSSSMRDSSSRWENLSSVKSLIRYSVELLVSAAHFQQQRECAYPSGTGLGACNISNEGATRVAKEES